MVTRVWSSVRSAIFSPSPTSPTSRSPGIRQFSKCSSRVGRALDAELALLLAEREPGVRLLDDERRDVAAAPAVGVGHREHRVVLRDAGVGDPRLLPGEHPVVAVRPRPGLHRRGVGPGLPLGQAVGERRLAPRQRRQVLRLDLVADAARISGIEPELVDRRDQRRRRADPRHLLDDDAGRERVGADAVVLLGHVRREEVAGHERVVRLLRVARLLVDLRRVRGDLVLGDRADRLADGLVLLGQLVQVER